MGGEIIWLHGQLGLMMSLKKSIRMVHESDFKIDWIIKEGQNIKIHANNPF